MPRTYKRKTTRDVVSSECLLLAIRKVKLEKQSVRKTAREFGISHQKLSRYSKLITAEDVAQETFTLRHLGYGKNKKLFSYDLEYELEQSILHGNHLTPIEIRRVAYQFAVSNSIPNIPVSWHKNKQTGIDWYIMFMKRHPMIFQRKVDGMVTTSSHSHEASVKFFEHFISVLMECQFEAGDIWNVDGTHLTSIVINTKPVLDVTMVAAVSATGKTIPPYLISVDIESRCKEYYLNNSLDWMEENNFLTFMNHFIRNADCSTEKPCLLLLKNHLLSSTLNYAKQNGITILFFPPNCGPSYKRPPLDQTVFEPFHRLYKSAVDAWMVNNPEHTISYRDVRGMVSCAYPLAATPINITEGFRMSGIWPVNKNLFNESSCVPDEPIIHSARDWEKGADSSTPILSNVKEEPLDGEPFNGDQLNIYQSIVKQEPEIDITDEPKALQDPRKERIWQKMKQLIENANENRLNQIDTFLYMVKRVELNEKVPKDTSRVET